MREEKKPLNSQKPIPFYIHMFCWCMFDEFTSQKKIVDDSVCFFQCLLTVFISKRRPPNFERVLFNTGQYTAIEKDYYIQCLECESLVLFRLVC